MNIKRAFLTASAVLMLPAAALAQETLTFDTDLSFSNGGKGSAVATLTCNTGVPLTQPFNISDDEGVVFVINEVTIDADTWCEITVTSVGGYESAEAEANTVDTGDTCYYTGGDAPSGEAALEIDNTCTFSLEPIGFVYIINKEWETFNGSLEFEGFENLEYELEGKCVNVRANPDDTVSLEEATFSCERTGTGATSCSSTTWYADPNGTTVCTASENIEDSAVEQEGCESGTKFTIGGATTGSCLITNTVFFEGIPTLSQYGLAIMALLMLGVGYVGFRRFV